MGFDLCRGLTIRDADFEDWQCEGDIYRVNVSGWSCLIDEAQEHGWKPAGTGPPETLGRDPGWPWGGGYGSNDYQRVTDADAAAWADALERGKPYEDISPRWREMVDEFIAYCRRGGFLIG